ncbi:type IV secretory system conjugative DNA transfer family protein [Cytobacillus oceanisediminis]|uniref:type IV secretory system conjugative DNA transfer family protein n=1 Tax=Cytobacillus oceanisediminis TaxID=665099 RepID=UPI001FB3CD67|nr:type IV secretion system DNA-binding domain-containing protein [Cytobacillus oceanisediminis]UOE53487.1 type IV secretion system DNA-binding domain-containing protein [Cytobacillus oceanisediminis]
MFTKNEIEILEGMRLENQYRLNTPPEKIQFIGNHQQIPLPKSVLEKHLLFIGGIGTGKTNAMFQLVDQLVNNLNDEDVMVIFDTKGDFYNEFYREGVDVVISNDPTSTHYWNMLQEALLDGEEDMETAIREMATALFDIKIKNSGGNSFFPAAARDVLIGIMKFLVRIHENSGAVDIHDEEYFNIISNECLSGYIQSVQIQDLNEEFQEHEDLKALNDMISRKSMGQALGVMSDLRQVCSEVFIGNFKKDGDFSIREFIRNKGGKILFIEYDISIGSVLGPIYKLLFDLAIKEALSRKKSEGNVYFIIDEFKLLPNLYHIESGINFGRSLGAKFIIAMQNVEQIRDPKNYGNELANSILSGISTTVSFRVTDPATRDFIKGLFGTQTRKILHHNTSFHNAEHIVTGNVVEDWDIMNLAIGEGIVALPGQNPIKFQFNEYIKERTHE